MKVRKRTISFCLALVLFMTSLLSSRTMITAQANMGIPTVSIEDAWGKAGSIIDVNVLIADNPGIMGSTLTFEFAPELTLVDAKQGEAFSMLDMAKPGQFVSPCKFAWDGQDLTDENVKDGVILTLSFMISEGAQVGSELPVNVSYEDVYDRNIEPIDINTISGKIKVLDYTPGDLNDDGKIDTADVIRLRRYNVGGYNLTINEAAADVNEDGKRNTADIIFIRRYIVGGYGIVLKPSSEVCEHEMEATEAKSATCTEDGNIAYWYCGNCRKYFSNANGTKTIELENTVIEAVGHMPVVDSAVEPTYTSTGLTEGSHCSVCNTIIVAQEEIPVLKKNEYFITYDIANGDTYLAGLDIKNTNPSVYTKQDGLILKDLSVPGYKFKGWYTAPIEGNKVSELDIGTTGEKKFYAQWERIVYTVIFDSPDVPVPNVTYTVDTGVTLTNPTWFGYTFVGWSKEGKIISMIEPGTTGNITLHANWTSNRNRAKAVEELEDPIVIEDMDNEQYLFVYEIGTIENVPLGVIEKIGNTKEFSITRSFEYARTLGEGFSNTVAETVSNATTKTSSWTLSEDWNQSTSATNEHDEEIGRTDQITDSEGNVIDSKYYISNVTGGETSSSKNSGGSNATSSKVTKDTSTGINGSYTSEQENSSSVGLHVDASLSAEMNAGTKNNNVKLGGSISAGATTDSELRDKESNTIAKNRDENVGTENVDSSESHWDTSHSSSSSWNTTNSYESSSTTSRNTEVSNTISKMIYDRYSYTSTEDRGGSNSATQSTDTSQEITDEYTSTIEYSVEEQVNQSEVITLSSDATGYYRVVTTGTVHVFAVVGYDIATNSYFTYTYNILDKERNVYLDYSKDNANFNDCENAILPFEIPYFVHEYVSSKIARSQGLTVNTDTGLITEYSGDSPYVVIPEYISVDNGDGTYSAIRIRGIESDAFNNNKDIKGVVFPQYIYEIPDGAFEGCSSLETIIGYGIDRIGNNAFKECTSLKKFLVDKYITFLGTNAFENVPEISVVPANVSVADAALNSGAKKITINTSKMQGTFDNKKIMLADTTEYFALLGNGVTYNNFQIESNATETYLNHVTFANNTDTPLKLNSEKVTLNRITINNSPGYALILSSDNTELNLYGDVDLSSISKDTVISKNIALVKSNPEVAGTLKVRGNYLVCGVINNDKMLSVTGGEVVTITEEEFNNRLTSCVVTFNANGGTVSQNQKSVYYGQKYGSFPTPTRQNYAFTGWYTAASGGIKVTTDTVVTALSNHTLYAQWNANTYKLTFNANGGSVSETSRTATCGQAIGTLPTPTRQYHTFTGWYTAASGGTKVSASTVFNTATTLYARWKINTYTLTFNANGGSVAETSRTVNCGVAIGNLPTPTKNHHTFMGWYTAVSGGTKVSASTTFNTATTLYARWEEKGISGWVKASEVPAGAQIVNTKWTYTLREYKESSSSSLSGYTKYDTKRTGWGGTQGPVYSNPSNGARNVWSEQYVTSSNYKTVYHYFRYSKSRTGSGGSDKSTTTYGTNYYTYDFDYALTLAGSNGNYARGYKYYYNAATGNTVSGSYITVWACSPLTTQEWVSDNYGTRWYYQEPVYTYYYYRDLSKESTSDPTAQANVSNVVKYVQYRPK